MKFHSIISFEIYHFSGKDGDKKEEKDKDKKKKKKKDRSKDKKKSNPFQRFIFRLPY